MTPQPEVIYLADHSFLLALPAFGPAAVVAAVVLLLAVRDQRRRKASPPLGDTEDTVHTEVAGRGEGDR